MAAKIKKKKYTFAGGRRKTSSARVRLFKGDGEHQVNGMVIGKYFPGETMRLVWNKPFELTQTVGKYFITVKVIGGGRRGQVEAVALATSRAFSTLNREKYRAVLKSAGLLTRDPRTRERRKVGTGGKARRAKQSPKR